MRSIILLAALAFATPSPASVAAKPSPSADVTRLRLNPARIDATLRRMVADGRVAGVEVLIWKDGREAFYGKAGWADVAAKRPIARSDLFQVWSMTKPVTGVGLMRLWEQGRFGLDEPLSKYLPEFLSTPVATGMRADGSPILRPPSRPILIRDILRHTAGFAYWAGEDTYPERMIAKIDPLNDSNTLVEANAKLATIPLMFDPGTRWRYSAAVDVQARLIEVLSGQDFETYMRGAVLAPLGMTEAGWTQPESRYPRLVTPYRVGSDKRLEAQPEAEKRRRNFSGRKLVEGGSGIAATIDDYMRFARMMLGKGALGQTRILRPSTVELMTTNQLDPKITDRWWLPEKGNGGFGFDVFVRTGRPRSVEENRGSVGEFFWDGGWSTLFWVDPANDMAVVFFVQKEPYDFSLHHDIRQAVYGPGYLGPEGD